MYAVIKTGGKQYKVQAGDLLKIELIDAEVGQEVSFSEVLMVVDGKKTQCGAPRVAGVAVKAEVVEHGRHKKVNIIKFRRRKHYMRRMGHRQDYTQVKIISIA